MCKRDDLVRRAAVSCALLTMTVAALFQAPAARADGSSWLTLGVGGGLGMRSENVPEGPTRTSLVNQANVRLKLFFLGVDFGYDLQRDASLVTPADALQYRAKARLTAMIYPYQGDLMSFYLGVGVGGTKLDELKRLAANGNSYHVGLGMEFHVTSHFSIDLSFMMVVPGLASIKRTTMAEMTAAYERAASSGFVKVQTPAASQFITLENHEAMLRVLLFL